jgi:hypothetical protein
MKPREHNMLKAGERQRQARQWQWRKAKILFVLSFVVALISLVIAFLSLVGNWLIVPRLDLLVGAMGVIAAFVSILQTLNAKPEMTPKQKAWVSMDKMHDK